MRLMHSVDSRVPIVSHPCRLNHKIFWMPGSVILMSKSYLNSGLLMWHSGQEQLHSGLRHLIQQMKESACV